MTAVEALLRDILAELKAIRRTLGGTDAVDVVPPGPRPIAPGTVAVRKKRTAKIEIAGRVLTRARDGR